MWKILVRNAVREIRSSPFGGINGVATTRRVSRRPGSWTRTQCGSSEPLELRLVLSPVNMTDNEQLLLELVNRARGNPSAEAVRYGIGLNDGLPANTISSAAKQPLAPHQVLVNVAGAHSLDMLTRDYFEHESPDTPPTTPSSRLDAAGYNWSGNAENIGWQGTTGTLNQVTSLEAVHEGLFKSPGHRVNIMNPAYEELGPGVRYGVYTTPNNSGVLTNFNAVMVTENFGRRNLNPFLTGVVYTDTNANQFYSVNEAVRSGTITAYNTATGAVFTETIGNSGGYGISVPAGNYSVSARYRVGATDQIAIRTESVAADNVKVDFVTGTATLIELSLTPDVSSIVETGNPSTATVTMTRTGDLGTAVVFTLTSSDTSEATVPATVTIPVGQTSATFVVTAVNDGIVDADQLSTITATAVGYPTATTTITTVNTTTSINLTMSPSTASLNESGVSTSRVLTVTRSGDSGAELVVSLVSSDTTETTVPLSVTIAAGQPSATFTVTSVIDGIIDGNQSSTITASATGYPSPTSVITTVDKTSPMLPSTIQEVATSRPTISWTAISNAATYEIWIDNVSTGESKIFSVVGLLTAEFTPATDLPVGQFRVWVRGFTSSGLASLWSPPQDWRVKTPPTVNGHGTTQSTGSFPITWSAVPGATTYDVWIDRLTSSTSQYLRNTSVAATALTVTNFEIGQYAVWVRGRNAQGLLTNFSARIVITVNLIPDGLAVTSPSLNGTPIFSWNSVPGATQYEVWVNNLTTATSKVVHNTAVTSTSLSLAGLTSGSYRAWVRARDSKGGNYTWTTPFDFEVQRAPRVLSPVGATGTATPLFSWTAVSGAARYELWVTNMDTVIRVIHVTDITATSFQSLASLSSGNYRTWVRAIDAGNVPTVWSTPANFAVAGLNSEPSKSPVKHRDVEDRDVLDSVFSELRHLDPILVSSRTVRSVEHVVREQDAVEREAVIGQSQERDAGSTCKVATADSAVSG